MEVVVNVRKYFDEENNEIRVITEINNVDYINKALEFLGYSVLHKLEQLRYALRKLFRRHKVLYEFVNFKYTGQHHPDDRDFYEVCNGFRQFLKDKFNVEKLIDLAERDLQWFADVIALRLRWILQQYEKNRNIDITVQSKLIFSPLPTEQKTNIRKIDVELANAILITNNQAYKIQLLPLNIKSFEDLISQATDSLHQMYKLQLQAHVNALQSQIQKLQEELEKTRVEAFIQGLKTFEVVKKLGWTIKDCQLYYTRKIQCKFIKYEDRVYKIPKQYKNKFYIKGIKIPLDATVTKAYAEQAYHCNVDSNGQICLGSLEGKQLFEVLQKLPETLKTLNLDSAFDNNAKKELEDIIDNEELEEVNQVWEA